MKLTSKRILAVAALALVVGACTSALAQDKKPLTLDDVIAGGKGYARLSPRLKQVTAVTNHGALLRKENAYYLIDKKGQERELLSLSEWKMAVGDDEQGLPYLNMNEDNGVLTAESAKGLYVFDVDTRKVVQVYAFDRNKYASTDLSARGQRIALMDGKNITVLEADGTMTPITTDGTADVVYGEAAHRNEFNTHRGTLWSPSGRYLAYYRVDRSGVEAYPLVSMEAPIAKLIHCKYPMAGRTSESVSVHIYDTNTKSTQVIKSDWPSESYFTNWAWSPDESRLYIEEVKRNQKEARLVAYAPQTGERVATLLTETHPKYVEPSAPILFVPGKPKLFVRTSRVAGYNHVYLHNTQGKKVKQLTSGDCEVKALVGMDPKGQYLYYVSNEGYHIGQALWRVALSSGKRECVTGGKGFHQAYVSPDKSLVVDVFSNLNTPGVLSLVSTVGKPKSMILDTAKNLLSDYYQPEIELGTIKAADGKTDLYYKMTRPSQIEAGKKYPVIVYVYGGPHAQLVTDGWRSLRMTWDNYMAQQGYIVFTIDNRGSANRGLDFESVTHRRLGTEEMADQMKGVDFLKSLPYVDADRIGVHGWSFGGFMTTNLMLTHPNTFKVGVAGGPVMDWSFYEIMYGERYMETPSQNPKGYAESNLIKRAGDLKGRLMLIHGDIDPVVVWQHSLLFVKAAVTAGTMPDYMVYPGHEHNVRGIERVHLYKTITRYFTDHL